MADGADVAARAARAVEAARCEKPLVGSVTNTVTVNLVANAQLAVGGSAAMVYLPDEAEFLAHAAGAFYLNMGTLMPIYAETVPRLARVLHSEGIPWVLDPVGIGIGSLRESLLLQLKQFKPSVIRCNASEAIALSSLWGLTRAVDGSGVRGVDSTDEVDDARRAAEALAQWTGGAVAVSGPVDLVTNGTLTVLAAGGSSLMERITGAGCSLGGVAAVYAAVAEPFNAALAASVVFDVAGSRAAAVTSAPASFQTAFLDELSRLRGVDVSAHPLDIKEA